MLAQAAQRVLQQNQSTVAQQQAQQMAQDPVVQMQQQELAIKQADLQRKTQKDQVDAQLKKRQQDLEAARNIAQNENALKKDKLQLVKDIILNQSDKSHEQKLAKQDIMADALKNIYQTNTRDK